MRRHKGLTLAEVLVAASLSLLLLGLALHLWRLEHKAWSRLADAQEAQSNCLCAAQSVRNDFARALPDSLTIRRLSAGFEFGFLCCGDRWNEDGEARPECWVLYRYQPAFQTLERISIPVTPDVDAPTAASPLPAWTGPPHIVARHLSRAELSSLHSNHLSLECHAQVRTQSSGTRIRVFPRGWSGELEEPDVKR